KGPPVFVDVSPIDYAIDVTKIEERITPKTKGIIAVSLFGQCADFDSINEIARKHGLWVIEDAAQSFGATYKGRRSCSLTEVAVTSFFPAKPLGCYGDGGAVFTVDETFAEKVRLLRSHGQVQRYHHHLLGINGRMDTLQAAILRVKRKHFEAELHTRRLAATLYKNLLEGQVFLPEIREYNNSTWAQFTIGVAGRDKLRNKLQEQGIPSSVHYPLPLPKQPAFSTLPSCEEEFPVSELLSETVLSLPMHGLITKEEVEEVARVILHVLQEWRR
ncbi:MAG TPA: DegT/DnrJ/EryC1/StrS family aminotransferase, partial [Prolixibacteraceae bacterium]|nr:DegT/DnrJ/EryC1/StrS family aminotransferase [Prolixibacteraceae bacterium]